MNKVTVTEQMLVAENGATMDEIIAATGGPQYNVLRRLEAKGYTIRRVKEGRATRYYATAPKPYVELSLSPKGQVTLPKSLREKLKFSPGGTVTATVEDDKLVLRRKVTTIHDLAGILYRPGMRARTIEEINEGIVAGAVERAMRGLKSRK